MKDMKISEFAKNYKIVEARNYHCYAKYNEFGNEANHNVFIQFNSKAERKIWLEKNWDSYDCNTYDKFSAVSRKEVEAELGKNFDVVKNICVRNNASILERDDAMREAIKLSV